MTIKNKPVAVLGSGPAGLLAAHGLVLAGQQFVIISEGAKSRLGGAQFLHRHIPLLTSKTPDAVITYRLRGNPDEYRRKVYGDDFVPFVSAENISDGMTQDAWSLLDTYEVLWRHFGEKITRMKLSASVLDALISAGEFSEIICTVPRVHLCRQRAGLETGGPRHEFHTQRISIHPAAMESMPDNTIVYDGTDGRTWYRSSMIMGVGGTEWAEGASLPPVEPIFKDNKPTTTTCDCYEGGPVVWEGRRGQWKKGILADEAFFNTARRYGMEDWIKEV